MPSTSTTTALLVALAVFAGCTGSPAPDSLTDDDTATDRAIDAETQRIERHFRNESGLGDLAFGAVADPYEATVTDRTDEGVVVDLTVAIGYRDACEGETPLYADGHRIETTYLVTANDTRLRSVAEPLPTC